MSIVVDVLAPSTRGVLQGLERLTELIFRSAKPKRLGSELVTGSMLAGLATAYVDAINGGAVPTIATAWQARRQRRLWLALSGCLGRRLEQAERFSDGLATRMVRLQGIWKLS